MTITRNQRRRVERLYSSSWGPRLSRLTKREQRTILVDFLGGNASLKETRLEIEIADARRRARDRDAAARRRQHKVERELADGEITMSTARLYADAANRMAELGQQWIGPNKTWNRRLWLQQRTLTPEELRDVRRILDMDDDELRRAASVADWEHRGDDDGSPFFYFQY